MELTSKNFKYLKKNSNYPLKYGGNFYPTISNFYPVNYLCFVFVSLGMV